MKKINLLESASKVSIKTVFALSLLLLLISAVGYWKYILTDPDKVFEGALRNSLQTKSVTKIIEQKEEGNYSKQTIALRFNPSLGVASKYELKRGEGDQQAYTQTEVLGFKHADYIRYNKIQSAQISDQKRKDIEGVWAKVGEDEASGQKPSVYNDALFSVIIFGDLPDDKADKVMQRLLSQDVYGIDSYSTKTHNGRLVANMVIKVKPKNLVESIKYYAGETGYIDVDKLESEGLSNEPISLDLRIDLISRQISEINYAGGQRVEQYGAYGQYRNITLPEKPISFDQLSQKIQSLQ